ncbi:30S ribosomal protein S20 [Candidatus Phytoplasma australiense]|uniref:Small ribosomal subunit protein bS20 n=2 Tax=Phytoplasma australiense TaxID=59748 RepID=RS20_PHYAS|nr:30S ribosomal protein S20 [Candidatus Phytoplasma australiense]B1VAG0.1 RecName: Full=Small ribosomal subunit protein bS20; AltName: Full=30S ribosomal protein S20 [Candidatus Phytoplasma australiense]AGL90320.1 30S ribosomal protein S20 [Strawberry lethal yellows phytoplasma (CPA) str. NZSb11]CAM11933.1 30S ribosomal protein S20 [Candidatus Phytoplasma australiense]
MANIKQQKKRNKTNEKRRLRNISFKSATKTIVKQVKIAVEQADKAKALANLSLAYQKLDKGASKKIYHANFVNRNKANLQKLVNTILS